MSFGIYYHFLSNKMLVFANRIHVLYLRDMKNK